MLALTDANPPIDIKKLLFKKDNEKDTNALLMKLIKSTTIPKPQKEKVLLALSDAPGSSSKTISIIEKNLGHKVNKIVQFFIVIVVINGVDCCTINKTRCCIIIIICTIWYKTINKTCYKKRFQKTWYRQKNWKNNLVER